MVPQDKGFYKETGWEATVRLEKKSVDNFVKAVEELGHALDQGKKLLEKINRNKK